MAEQVLIPSLAAVPTAVDVVALQAVTEYPAVSVLMTTTPAERMTADYRDRLHGLVRDAVSRLRAQPPVDQARPFADALRCLALEAAQDATRQAVGLFVSRETNVLWRLSVPVHDRTVIGSTFATRDLVRSLHRTPRHVVLVLTEHNAKLYDGIGDLLTPAITPAFPVHRASAFEAFLRTV